MYITIHLPCNISLFTFRITLYRGMKVLKCSLTPRRWALRNKATYSKEMLGLFTDFKKIFVISNIYKLIGFSICPKYRYICASMTPRFEIIRHSGTLILELYQKSHLTNMIMNKIHTESILLTIPTSLVTPSPYRMLEHAICKNTGTISDMADYKEL